MERFDKDHKGSLTKSEVPDRLWERVLSKSDSNNDGVVTKDELESHLKSVQSKSLPQGTDAKPGETPKDDKSETKPVDNKPQEAKPAESKPQARSTVTEQPADATAAFNAEKSDQENRVQFFNAESSRT